jgi:hypothetical protein
MTKGGLVGSVDELREEARAPGGYFLPPGADGSVAWQLLAVQPVRGHMNGALAVWLVVEATPTGSAKARPRNWTAEWTTSATMTVVRSGL